ncbi:MAG: glycosyltransferase family 39 protein [Acidimicrobiales bacterium]
MRDRPASADKERGGGGGGAAVAATALAAALGAWHLGEKSLWVDEGVSYFHSQLDMSSLWSNMVNIEPNQALHYGLLKLWTAFGTSEAMLRTPSVIAFAATVPFAYGIAAELWGRRTAVLAGFLVALNGFLVHYAQEARPYALAAMFVTASSYFFVVGLRRQRRAYLLAWAVTTVLAVLAHLFAAFVVLAQLLSLPLVPDRRIPWRVLAWSAAVALLAMVPLGILLSRGNKRAGIAWIQQTSSDGVMRTLTQLAGGAGRPLLIATAAAAVVVVLTASNARDDSWSWWGSAFVIRWAIVPVAATILLSEVEPLFVARYLIVAVPALAILVATGLAQIRPRLAFVAAVVVFGLLASQGVRNWYRSEPKEDWRDAAAFVAEEAETGDAVIIYRFGRDAFLYYYGRDEGDVPASIDVIQANRLPESDLLELLADHDRVWLLWYQHGGSDAGLRDLTSTIALDHSTGPAEGFHLINVWRYERRPR